MDSSRQRIARSASEKLAAAASRLASMPALVGLDGFVDEIVAVVEKRHGFDRYDPVPTIQRFGEKIASAVSQSSNYELVVRQRKLGGNGPIMANALASLGMGVTYIGNLGYPDIDPVFAEFARKATLISIGQPAHTDALEFADGKLMFGKLTPLDEVNWENLTSRIGVAKLTNDISRATLIGMVNWTMLPHMSRIWEGLIADVLPNLQGPRRTIFIDLADPEKRTREDIGAAMKLLNQFQARVDVILGLNLKESMEIAAVLGLPGQAEADVEIQALAASIRHQLQISCVVIHPRHGAAAATQDQTAWFTGPFVEHPQISTGAGDHFNAGFALARVLGMSLEESLCVGVSESGYYVRTARSPSAPELSQFIAQLHQGSEG